MNKQRDLYRSQLKLRSVDLIDPSLTEYLHNAALRGDI